MTLCPHNTGTGRQYRHALPCTVPSVVSMLMVRHSRAEHTRDNCRDNRPNNRRLSHYLLILCQNTSIFYSEKDTKFFYF